jgi:hypothetical protein
VTKEDPLVGKYRIWALVQKYAYTLRNSTTQADPNGNITLAQYEAKSKDGIMPTVPLKDG